MRWRPVLRGLAALAALILLAASLWGVAFILLIGGISAQAPDPLVADGDPCCGHPDTWGEVASGVAWTLGLILVDGLLVAGAVALIGWAASTSWLHWRRLSLIPLSWLLAGVLVFAVILTPLLSD